ncbi:MAG: helix-turn-helix domain-containing protein [Bacteroidales bacterium]|nr:helix-turn-helix domain-containing protein [Bacteroidales bacterium]
MQQHYITELDLQDVPQVYRNLKYNDGEIYFADNITSIPGLMKQFKVNFIAYVMVTEGRLTVDMNNVTYHLEKNCSLFVDRKMVIENVKHTENFSCVICAMSTDMGFAFFNKSLLQSIIHIMANPVIKMEQTEVDLMMKYYDLLVFKMDHQEMSLGRETVRDIIRCFAYDLLSNINRHLNQDNDDDMLRQSDRIYRRFMFLLADNTNVNRSVKSYADELCVSPKYLTSVCRKHSDCTASELIATAVISRIKQLLLYSDLSIKEVASEMGFDNLSFFGKYVKKHLGLSPNHYRKANGYGR